LRSAWARGPRTAGPLRRLSTRNWMPPASAARPIRPSSASISRTRWPLPSPPIAGLQDIAPMVANRCVTSAVLPPIRAAAAAASQPACPPPITMTSNFVLTAELLPEGARANKAASRPGREMFHVKHLGRELLSDTEIAEDDVEHVLDIDPAG